MNEPGTMICSAILRDGQLESGVIVRTIIIIMKRQYERAQESTVYFRAP